MANVKPTFAKLKLQKNVEVKTIVFNDFEIEVKQYLPVNDKLALISRVLNQASDENNYSNPVKEDIFGTLEIIFAYTNIGFTDKQKEDPCNLYDTMVSSGLADMIIDAIPRTEYNAIVDGINLCGKAIYTYRNSVMGILDIVSTDYSALELDATNIQKALGDPSNMALLRDILTKLG
jgi:hypothetical protein